MFAYVLDAPAVMKDLRKLLTPEQKWKSLSRVRLFATPWSIVQEIL